ncbi:formate dehydrogenase accessory sulfurtransferase FdhD [Maricaulis maris]|uniref:Sulfur carrier protein FdhD n=1 Tax=Maricaulis maris TaxID=74318 RepID=A0A495D362_9PROT|nr:formate dehydrogenase accessory sulfurtransferase FdhD [Maricaulis maris]RKQ96208.1 FdhD protein [Maricaulis maris]
MSNRLNNTPVIHESGEAAATASDVELADGTRWAVPNEVPVAITYNRRNHAVMLATPADLADFAIGFSLSEGLVRQAGEIEAIEIIHQPLGVDLHITLNAERLERFDLIRRRRTLPGRAGCGLCGLENAESLTAPLPRVADTPADVTEAALATAFATLADWQPLNARTRSVHAAAWAGCDGSILAAREDVGRHNALDKLVGALAHTGQDMFDGFLVMSSRASYELIEKAARAGMPALASLSAPTLLAIDRAKQANIRLYAASRGRFVAVT